MKKFLSLLLSFIPLLLVAETPFFEGTFDGALIKAKNENKFLLLKFYSDT